VNALAAIGFAPVRHLHVIQQQHVACSPLKGPLSASKRLPNMMQRLLFDCPSITVEGVPWKIINASANLDERLSKIWRQR